MAVSVTAVPRRIMEENTAAVMAIRVVKVPHPITNTGMATKVMAIIRTEEAARANHFTSSWNTSLHPSTLLRDFFMASYSKESTLPSMSSDREVNPVIGQP